MSPTTQIIKFTFINRAKYNPKIYDLHTEVITKCSSLIIVENIKKLAKMNVKKEEE